MESKGLSTMDPSAALGEEDANEADELAGISRRSIYFHRLIGDVFEQHQTQTTKRAPWHIVIRFLLYASIASWAIYSRTDIENVSQVNASIKAQLQRELFNTSGGEFKNLSAVEGRTDFFMWVIAITQSLQASFRYGLPLSLTSYNRMVPLFGMCSDVATIAMTFRRMKRTSDFEETTTERFRALYPKTWVADTLSSGAQSEDTAPLIRYVKGPGAAAGDPVCGFNSTHINSTHSGGAAAGGNGSYVPMTWHYADPGQKWSYKQDGGLVVLFTVESNSTPSRLFLVDAEVPGRAEPETGTDSCVRDPRLTEITIPEFGCFDMGESLSFLGVEFETYNANMQSLTLVHAFVQMNAAGFIEEQGMTTDTIRLDLFSSYLNYVDAAYFMGTCCYLVGLCRDLCSLYPDILNDGWTYINTVSIVCSFMSLLLWYIYTSRLSTFKQTSEFQEPHHLQDQITVYRTYIRFSAFATLMIYFRILQFLGKTQLRVKLLLSTMFAGAKAMGTYAAYILIICFGSVAFAYTKFSAESKNFTTLPKTVYSCFAMMFGSLEPMRDINHGVLASAFLVFYMVIFYIITSQMFNAILNYSYNRTYEQMEPELKRQERSQQRKQLPPELGGNKRHMHALVQLRQHIFERIFKSKAQENPEGDEKVVEMDQGQASVANLPDDLREKVTAHVDRHKKMKPREGVSNWILFLVFIMSYLWFLWVNLYIPENALIRRAIESSISDASFNTEQDSLGGTRISLKLADAYKLRFAARWIGDALQKIGISPDSLGEGPSSHHCMKQWNCIVALPKDRTGPPKVFRITSRRFKVSRNDGGLGSGTPAEDRFIGGFVEANGSMRDRSSVLVSYRLPSSQIAPASRERGSNEDGDLNFTLDHNGDAVCETKAPGEGGYLNNGGIVCLLDANRTDLNEVTRQMVSSGLFGFTTGSIVLEFMVYTGNVNVLSYVSILFVVLPGGQLRQELYIQPMRLFDIDIADARTIIVRICPGILYLVLVLRFLWNLVQELFAEKRKHKLKIKDGKSAVTITFEFFAYDVFNLMELISITLSIVSFGLFTIWIVRELGIGAVKEEGFTQFLDFGSDLAVSALTYNRLSAINLLVIFIRPLKFARNNARVIQFYQTLSQTCVDMYWFLCITIIILIGFVVFAYISFGTRFVECSTLADTLAYCFAMILGKSDTTPLNYADPVLAPVFIVPFLIIFRFFILKIFFAIIDRRFVSADPPPPETLKRTLKPLLKNVCRWCVDWDEDHTLNADLRSNDKDGPPSRAERVHKTAQEIERIRFGIGGEQSGIALLSDVCDTEGQLHEVLHWSRQEAKDFVELFRKLLAQKQESRDEADFVQKEVMKAVEEQTLKCQNEMDEAERYVRYDTNVHEKLVMHDQETLAKYILLLEGKIKGKIAEKHALREELYKLRTESDCMRFTQEEMRGGLGGSGSDGAPPGVAVEV